MPDTLEVSPAGATLAAPAEIGVAQRLRKALAASERLHEISTQLLQQDDPEAIFRHILKAAVEIMGSDFASIQRYDPESGMLILLANVGFSEENRQKWQVISTDAGTSCAVALARRTRVVISDMGTAQALLGAANCEAYIEADIQSLQSTPLTSRSGQLLGMISTHWRDPHEPQPDELRLIDVLARQAADVIERREAETALRQSEAELQVALARAQQAAREKDELIGLISHEFRNPLVTILGNVGVLHRRTDIDDQTRELLMQDLERDGMRLKNLIENMLVLTKTEYSPASLEPVLLQRVLPGLVETERQRDPRREIRLDVPEGLPPVLASPSYFGQVVENLVTNSRKYSDAGNPIELRVAFDASITISVLDRGRVYSDEEVARFFEPFFRDPGTSERAGGLGLGMSVCARLVELQGGSLTVRPRAGGGIDAAFTLQVAE